MFLTDTVYNRPTFNSISDISNEGFKIALESEQVWHNITKSMVRLEHTAIINNDYSLLSEGNDGVWEKIKAFFKKLWEKIKAFFKAVWEKIKSIAQKIKNFIFGKKDDIKKNGNKKGEVKKSDIKMLENVKLLAEKTATSIAKDGEKPDTNMVTEITNDQSTTAITVKQAADLVVKSNNEIVAATKTLEKAQIDLERIKNKAISDANEEAAKLAQEKATAYNQLAGQIISSSLQGQNALVNFINKTTGVTSDGRTGQQNRADVYQAFNSPEFDKQERARRAELGKQTREKNRKQRELEAARDAYYGPGRQESFLPYGILDQF